MSDGPTPRWPPHGGHISNEATNYAFLVTRRTVMIPFIKKYAKAIVAAIGYAVSIATALGLTHYHWVSIVLGVLSTIAVIITRNTVPNAAGPARPAAR